MKNNPYSNFRNVYHDFCNKIVNNSYEKIPTHKEVKFYFWNDDITNTTFDDILEDSISIDQMSLKWKAEIIPTGYSWIDLQYEGIYEKVLYISILHSVPMNNPGVARVIRFYGPRKEKGLLGKWYTKPVESYPTVVDVLEKLKGEGSSF